MRFLRHKIIINNSLFNKFNCSLSCRLKLRHNLCCSCPPSSNKLKSYSNCNNNIACLSKQPATPEARRTAKTSPHLYPWPHSIHQFKAMREPKLSSLNSSWAEWAELEISKIGKCQFNLQFINSQATVIFAHTKAIRIKTCSRSKLRSS